MNITKTFLTILGISPFLFLSYCASSDKTIQEEKNQLDKSDSKAFALSNLPDEVSGMKILNASTFGCIGDGIQLFDISLSGNELTSPSANFSVNDLGKVISVANAGEQGHHLVSTIKSFVSVNKVILKHSAINNVTSVTGSYGTDNIDLIQTALNAAIKQQKILYFNAGVYLVGYKNNVSNSSSIMVNTINENDNVVIIGSGKEQTVFRELDGKTQKLGRYTKIFYHYLKDSPNVGAIVLSDFALDKNARSLTKPPSRRFEWEQAHAWSWAGHKNGADFINKIYISNVEIIDKIGGGINFSSSTTKVGSVLAQNITISQPKNNLIKFGYRGDLEISCFSDDIVIKNSILNYVQLEPVKSMTSTKSNRRFCSILDSNISTIEFTESSITERNVSKITLKNTTTTNFRTVGVEFYVEDSTVTLPNLVNSVYGVFKNSTILIPYDLETNTVKTINASYLRTIPNPNNITFLDSDFLIKNDNPLIQPKGFAITSSAKMKKISENQILIENCTFDNRLAGSVDAYANGEWTLINNMFAGTETVIKTGGYKNYASNLKLYNNNYSYVKTSANFLLINNNNELWNIEGEEKSSDLSKKTKVKGGKGNIKNQTRL